VEYDQGRRPRVTVVDPPLQRHDGQQLPHVFPGDDLCGWDPGRPALVSVAAGTIRP
jgi:hypothetical protein